MSIFHLVYPTGVPYYVHNYYIHKYVLFVCFFSSFFLFLFVGGRGGGA